VKRGPASSGDVSERRADRDVVLRQEPSAARRSVARRFGPDALVVAAILLVGVSRLPAPFTGDQALNMLMGRVIANGGAPYIDLWDLKHPGIFFFFAAGGGLFGFNEIGIHLLELLWMLTLAVAVRVVAGAYLRSPIAAAVAPVLSVGMYYAVATSVHLTQTEGLIGLPMILCLAFAAAAVRPHVRWATMSFFASGLAAGLVLVSKAPYVVLCVIFWALALVEWRRHGGTIGHGIVKFGLPAFAGLLIPAAATAIYLAQKHALGASWWTFVVYPRRAVAETSHDFQLLRDATTWFVRAFAVPIAFAAVGAWERVRRGWDLITAALLAWVVAGAALIWAQVIGWWSYHYLLLVVPIGLLAAQGVETLARFTFDRVRPAFGRIAAGGALIALIALLLVSPVRLAIDSVSEFLQARPLPLTSDAARTFQVEHDQAYASAFRATAFLRTGESEPGPIYVFASPIMYVLSDRTPAIAYLATWFDPTNGAWHRMMDELTQARPTYIFVERGALGSLTSRNPTLADDMRTLSRWLLDAYVELRTDADGTWYQRS
jgi:hypothetical protein